MKYLTFILFLFLSLQLAYAQEPIDDRQLSLGVVGVEPTDDVVHYISAEGKVWEWSGTSFVISSDQEIYNNQTVSEGNANFTNNIWDAFFNWKWREPGERPIWGLGFYKISLILPGQEASGGYYYLDGRDSNWGGSGPPLPDLWTVYWVADEKYEIFNWSYIPGNITPIDNEEIIRVWDVKNSQPSTSGLTNFWANALLLIDGGDDHPRFAWGPHPSFTTTHFYIYRAVAAIPVNPKEELTFYLTGITNATTYEFIDTQFEIGGSPIHKAFYYVKAYNSSSSTYSSATNTVSTSGEYVPHKISVNPPVGIQVDEFDLMQNYPNPFNPSTTIHFSIAANSLVSLIVYDILGNEKAVLVDELKEPGIYSVNFDASNFASGIYFYTLRANEYTSSRKMLLLK